MNFDEFIKQEFMVNGYVGTIEVKSQEDKDNGVDAFVDIHYRGKVIPCHFFYRPDSPDTMRAVIEAVIETRG